MSDKTPNDKMGAKEAAGAPKAAKAAKQAKKPEAAHRKAAQQRDGGGLLIYTFGGFKLVKGDTLISNVSGRSRKMWDLFKFVVTMRDRKLSVLDCYEAIWGEDDTGQNPTAALQNLVYRLRRTLAEAMGGDGEGESYILYEGGCYFWNPEARYWLDAEEFESRAELARSLRETEPERAIELYKQAIDIYGGEYLSEYVYNTWVVTSRNRYSRVFVDCGSQLAEMLRQQERYQEILDLCEKMFALDAMNDLFHAIFIDALIDMGKIVQAQAHYQYVTSMLYREMGIKPTTVLRQAYERIRKSGGLRHSDLSQIQSKLNESARYSGAFYCEIDVFRAIYQLETRRMPRQGYSQFLCLATLSNAQDPGGERKDGNAALQTLIGVAIQALRAGDVVSKWNDDQVLLLLPSITVEDNIKVMKRIEQRFGESCTDKKTTLRLEYSSIMQM